MRPSGVVTVGGASHILLGEPGRVVQQETRPGKFSSFADMPDEQEQIDLTLDDYQKLALATWQPWADEDANMGYLALGLNGEAGEVAEHVKKKMRHGKELDRAAMKKELGDTLWYAAVMAHELGYTLEDVAADNIAKLRARYPGGFVQRWGNGK